MDDAEIISSEGDAGPPGGEAPASTSPGGTRDAAPGGLTSDENYEQEKNKYLHEAQAEGEAAEPGPPRGGAAGERDESATGDTTSRGGRGAEADGRKQAHHPPGVLAGDHVGAAGGRGASATTGTGTPPAPAHDIDPATFPTDWGYVIPDAPSIKDMDPEFVFSCPSSHPLRNNRVVQADVKRTRAAVPAVVAQHGRLETLITNYCQATDTFYRQGLNEILAPFLLLEPANDLKALIKFHGFFAKFCAPFFADQFKQMEAVLRTFDALLLYHFPDLHQELAINDLEPVVYATPWFVTIFASKMDDLREVVRLWKFYCIRNDPAYVAFIGLAMLKRAKGEILRTDVSALPGLLASLAPLPVDEVFLVADELYQQTPAVFATHIRYQLPWQSPLPPTGDPLDAATYLQDWDFRAAASSGGFYSDPEQEQDLEDHSETGREIVIKSPSSPRNGEDGGVNSAANVAATALTTLAGFGHSASGGSFFSSGTSNSGNRSPAAELYHRQNNNFQTSVGAGSTRVVGLTATEALQMLHSGSGKKRIHELQMMLIDNRPLRDFEDNGRLPSAVHCEDALTLHKMFSEQHEITGPSSTGDLLVDQGSRTDRVDGGVSQQLNVGSSRTASRNSDEPRNNGDHHEGTSAAVSDKINLKTATVHHQLEGASSSTSLRSPVNNNHSPTSSSLSTPNHSGAQLLSRFRHYRKVHLCVISKNLAYEAAFRYQIPFVSYVKGGYAALHDAALEQKMEMINHDRDKCYWCAPAWRQQAHSWKNWIFGAVSSSAAGCNAAAGHLSPSANENLVQWPVKNHEAQWRCRSGGCSAAVVTTIDNLLYLVEIDPEGQRVGGYVRVISKYPVFMISKITSKKSAKEPTRCFYFKDGDLKSTGGRKPYLGFSVTFDSEDTAKNCTTRVGECCRRACDENG
ncbi:unnamed protein product [Amoebophrya sp. A120]|nr:unnamed protein product [Amoebophrya sp. A120]|eukprot:GSA120T00012635001.1